MTVLLVHVKCRRKFEGCKRKLYPVRHQTCIVPSRNPERSSELLRFARNLHESLSQFGQRNYRSMLVPCHGTMPSFMILRRVWDLQEFKNQVYQCFRPSHDAQMFEFHSHSCMGPINSPKETHMIFQQTLVHWSMCL